MARLVVLLEALADRRVQSRDLKRHALLATPSRSEGFRSDASRDYGKPFLGIRLLNLRRIYKTRDAFW